MHRCYIQPESWSDDERPALSPEEVHHLVHVCRARPGDAVGLFDGGGRQGVAQVVSLDPLTLSDVSDVSRAERAYEAILYQAIPKGKRMDGLVEKATELGVATIVPMMTERVVVRWNQRQAEARVARWRKVALAAAKQCGIPWLPTITEVQSLDSAMAMTEDGLCVVGALVGERRACRDVWRACDVPPARVGIIIGPEGDLTEDELAHVMARGAIPVCFGPRVLRVDTAALYALSTLSYEFETA